ncbi:MAG: sugar porter family MFS transporter, partial [Bacteroidota bacterium]|nr:sugar porter family MFS transporter [Bacteroidota bacterium]
RFIGGVGIGISTIAAPAYISEISAPNERGKLVGYYQLNIVVGILFAFVSNFFLKEFGESSWRIMVGIEAIPAIIYTVMIMYISQSPRWTYLNGYIAKSEHIYEELFSSSEKEIFIKEISETKNEFQKDESIFNIKYRFILYLAFMIAFFNQFSGINAFLYYSPRIFQEGGLGENSAFLSSIGIGVTNLIFTIVGISLIDKVGRKVLMIVGSIGYIISLSFIFLSFLLSWGGIILPAALFLFIAAHAIGQGSVIWVYISEIFPNHIRSSGQSFGTSTHWVLAALIPSMIPFLFNKIGASYVFLIFLLMMIFQLIFVVFSMPETKGKSLETLSNKLLK